MVGDQIKYDPSWVKNVPDYSSYKESMSRLTSRQHKRHILHSESSKQMLSELKTEDNPVSLS